MKKILSFSFVMVLFFSCFSQVSITEVNEHLIVHKIEYSNKQEIVDKEILLQRNSSSTHWPDFAYKPETFIDIDPNKFCETPITILLCSDANKLVLNFEYDSCSILEIVKGSYGNTIKEVIGKKTNLGYEIEVIIKPNNVGGVYCICSPLKKNKDNYLTTFKLTPLNLTEN